MLLRSITLTGLAAAAASLFAAAGASAAVIAPTQPCFRQGYSPLAADGSFTNGFRSPLEQLSRTPVQAGSVPAVKPEPVKSYGVTATDQANPAISATTQATFVRPGVSTQPATVRRNVQRPVRWSIFGAPTGRKLYAHWTFNGRRYATRSLGSAKGACGVVRKRLPLVPAAPRRGTWTVYITKSRRLRRRGWLFRVDLSVYRASRARATADAAVRGS